MEEMPTFTNADIELLMTLSVSGMIMPEQLESVQALRDKLDAAIDYACGEGDGQADYEPYDDDDE